MSRLQERSFQLDYAYEAWEVGVKETIVDMAIIALALEIQAVS